jgi:hypothetical protein
MPPPAGAKSPALWGTEAYLAELFGPEAAAIHCNRRTFNFRYRSAEHFVEVFRTWYGPVHKAFAALGPKADALERDMVALIERTKRPGASALVIPGAYLEGGVVRA